MRKYLLFVLAAVLLTGMILSTATAGGPGPGYDEDSGPCRCEDRIDVDEDGVCDNCDHCIPLEDGTGPQQIKTNDRLK